MCKFINADAYVNANGDFVGFNMYAYCSNNPVMYVDPTGNIIMARIWSCIVFFSCYFVDEIEELTFSDNSVLANEFKESPTMNNEINKCIQEYKETGKNVFEPKNIVFESALDVDLMLGIHGGTYSLTISETTHTVKWLFFEKTYTDYIVNVTITDIYDFDGSPDADISNKFGYYFYKKGYATPYDIKCTYTKTFHDHYRFTRNIYL